MPCIVSACCAVYRRRDLQRAQNDQAQLNQLLFLPTVGCPVVKVMANAVPGPLIAGNRSQAPHNR